MRLVCLCTTLVLLCVLTGCVSVVVARDARGPGRVESSGFISGVVDFNGIAEYDGTIVRFGILTNMPRRGELVGIDVWPILGVGIGFLGARVQVLPLQVGVGAFWYEPCVALNQPPPGPPPDPPLSDETLPAQPSSDESLPAQPPEESPVAGE